MQNFAAAADYVNGEASFFQRLAAHRAQRHQTGARFRPDHRHGAADINTFKSPQHGNRGRGVHRKDVTGRKGGDLVVQHHEEQLVFYCDDRGQWNLIPKSDLHGYLPIESAVQDALDRSILERCTSAYVKLNVAHVIAIEPDEGGMQARQRSKIRTAYRHPASSPQATQEISVSTDVSPFFVTAKPSGSESTWKCGVRTKE
jgi:hypothetical protein